MSGYSLVSQQIRKLVLDGAIKVPEANLSLRDDGWFVDEGLEGRVQPASFEPTLRDEVFVLDTNEVGLFRPQKGQSVYRSLLELPERYRPRRSIVGGYELKKEHTYLIPLTEKIGSGELKRNVTSIKSSPKSSIGRVFPKTRLLADFNDAFDEVAGNLDQDREMWLVVQPVPFNLIIRPGLTLNQLRFFNNDARLSSREILGESEKTPLLYMKDAESEGGLRPIELSVDMVNDGVQLTLDLEGKATEGVVGLRARNNPHPIDLAQGVGCAEDYFEPIMSGDVVINRGDHCLFASNQVIYVPPHLSAEVGRHLPAGLEGSLHDAGFIDPGFKGDMVFEVRPYEETKIDLSNAHDMPLSKLDFFRGHEERPDKVYGGDIGSHYQSQSGPKHSKHLMPFNFGVAAKKHAKLDRLVLVQDAKVLTAHRGEEGGFKFMDEPSAEELFERIQRDGFFQSRYHCEDDPLLLQPIPYILLFGPDGTIFSYLRSSKIEEYGDQRLFGRHSLGVGGHIKPEDGPNYIRRCIERELKEEVEIKGSHGEPTFIGTLFSRRKPVDEVHLGLIYKMHVNGDVAPYESSLVMGEMVPIDQMRAGYHEGAETETWSELLIPHLKKIHGL